MREPDHWVSFEMTGSISFHIRLLKLFLKLLLKLFLNTCAPDNDHDIFDPGSRSDGLSLTRNWYGLNVLGIVQGQDYDSLGIVIGQSKT